MTNYVYAVFNTDGNPIGLSRVIDEKTAKDTLSLDFYKGKTNRVLTGTRYETHVLTRTLPTLSELDAQLIADGVTPQQVPLD